MIKYGCVTGMCQPELKNDALIRKENPVLFLGMLKARPSIFFLSTRLLSSIQRKRVGPVMQKKKIFAPLKVGNGERQFPLIGLNNRKPFPLSGNDQYCQDEEVTSRLTDCHSQDVSTDDVFWKKQQQKAVSSF